MCWDSFVKKWRNLTSNLKNLRISWSLALTCIFYDPWCEIAEWSFMNPACQDIAGGQWLRHIWQHQVMLVAEVPETVQRKKSNTEFQLWSFIHYILTALHDSEDITLSIVVIVFLQGLVTVWLELLDVKDSCPIVNYYGIKIHQLT